MSTRHDVFPAFVTFVGSQVETPLLEVRSAPPFPKGSHHLDKARVIVNGNHVLIAVDGNTGPQIVFDEQIDPAQFYKSNVRTEDSSFVTLGGTKVAYKKNEACGCGSRLRSWNPYRNLYSTQDPTE